MIEALKGQADAYPPSSNGKPPGDGVITATELYLYLRDAVEPASEGNRQRQTPGIWPLKKHDKGEYIFLSPGHPLNLPPAPPLDASKNPYRGLESFEEEHKDLFFGRTSAIAELLGLLKLLHTFTGHQGWVNSVAFSPDGKYIVSGSEDSNVRLWSIEGKLLNTLTGHQYAVMSVTFSPSGRYIISGGIDRTVSWWFLQPHFY